MGPSSLDPPRCLCELLTDGFSTQRIEQSTTLFSPDHVRTFVNETLPLIIPRLRLTTSSLVALTNKTNKKIADHS